MKKRILTLALLTVISSSLIPKPIQAYSKDCLSSFQPSVFAVDDDEGEYVIKIGTKKDKDEYLIGSSGLAIGKSKSGWINIGNADSSFKDLNLTASEKITLLRALNKVSTDSYPLRDIKPKDIAKEFDLSIDSSEDIEDRESHLLRDALLVSIYNDAKANTDVMQSVKTDIGIIAGSYKSPTTIAKSIGIKDSASLSKLFEVQDTTAVKDEQQDSVIKEQLKDISDKSFDTNNKFESACNVIRVMTTPNADTSCELIKTACTEYNCDTDEIMETLINSKDYGQGQQRALASLIVQRGSKYSYSSNQKSPVDISRFKGTDSSVNIDIIKGIQKEIESVLNGNKSAKQSSDRMLLTTGLRTKYCYYAMQTNSPLEEGVWDELCYTEDSNIELRTSNPIIFDTPQVQNMKYYVYLNNCVNEVNYAAQVLIPAFGTISDDTKINTRTMQNQLLFLKAQYDAVVFLRDKAEGSPEDFYKPIVEAWNRKVSLPDGSSKSLSDLYDELQQMGIDFGALAEFKEDSGKPLSKFFNEEEKTLCEEIQYGIALSSTFIPFKTNMYEPATYKILSGNNDFFKFHERYGIYRKAIMIDTNTSSSSELLLTGKSGTRKVCTLKDLLQCEKDITLYADGSFYNKDLLEQYRSEGLMSHPNTVKDTDHEPNVAPQQDANTGSSNSNSNSSNSSSSNSSIWNSASKAFQINLDDVLKTGSNTSYLSRLKDVTSYSDSKNSMNKELDDAVLDGNQIDEYLNFQDESDSATASDNAYNIMRSFAIVSSVYRDSDLFDMCYNYGNFPVFVSSKDLVHSSSANNYWKRTIFNYAMLKNIKSFRSVSWSSSLDYNKPVYLDVYGNILTESGDVVIPAASNATLNKEYSVVNAGFLSSYGKDYEIPKKYDVSSLTDINVFEVREDSDTWSLKPQSINGLVDLNRLSTASTETQSELFTIYATTLGDFDFERYVVNIFIESLRGAPLQNIDKNKENLVLTDSKADNAIVQGAKLEEFKQSWTNLLQNNVISLPSILQDENIAYYKGIIYLFVYLVCIICFLIYVFRIGYSDYAGIKKIGMLIVLSSLILVSFYFIPDLYKMSYYTINRTLLQDEALEISQLNLEKRESGLELGIEDILEPKTDSKLYIKMTDVDIPVGKTYKDIMSTENIEEAGDIYKKYASLHTAYGEGDLKFLNNALYISDEDLYNSTAVSINTQWECLVNTQLKEIPASFYTPYYYFLDSLVNNVNTYNTRNNVHTWFTQTYKGKIKCLGLSSAYLESDSFMSEDETVDILRIRPLYQEINLDENNDIYYDVDMLTNIKKSNWFRDNITDEQLTERIYKMDERARRFVLRNQDLIGRVSDETFLKSMALDLALYYNKIFSISSAKNIDIFRVSMDDMNRLLTAPRSVVVESSPYSYSRMLAEHYGEWAIYMAGAKDIIDIILGVVKPVCLLLTIIVIFISIFIYKMLLGKKIGNYTGFITTVLLATLLNSSNSLALKGGVWLVNLGCPTVLCLVLQCILSLTFILMYLMLATVVVLNWKDIGSASYINTMIAIGEKISKFGQHYGHDVDKNSAGYQFLQKLKARAIVDTEAEERRPIQIKRHDKTRKMKKNQSGDEFLEELYKRDEDKNDE